MSSHNLKPITAHFQVICIDGIQSFKKKRRHTQLSDQIEMRTMMSDLRAAETRLPIPMGMINVKLTPCMIRDRSRDRTHTPFKIARA